MSSVLRVSDAGSLALHTIVFLAARPKESLSVKTIAGMLHASQAHLAKVLQRLGRAGLVKSTRGPGGGFVLAKPADKIKLLDVYETIEGKLSASKCLLGNPVCSGKKCILGGLIESLNRQVSDYLDETSLEALTSVYGEPKATATRGARG